MNHPYFWTDIENGELTFLGHRICIVRNHEGVLEYFGRDMLPVKMKPRELAMLRLSWNQIVSEFSEQEKNDTK